MVVEFYCIDCKPSWTIDSDEIVFLLLTLEVVDESFIHYPLSQVDAS